MQIKNKKLLPAIVILFFLVAISIFFTSKSFAEVYTCRNGVAKNIDSSDKKYYYCPMENIPGVLNTRETAPFFNEYIASLYGFLIGLVGICALFMITLGGYMYLTSAGNTALMGRAKSIILDAVIGLVIALLSYLIFFTINPSLVRDVSGLSSAPSYELDTSGTMPYDEIPTIANLGENVSKVVYINGTDPNAEKAMRDRLQEEIGTKFGTNNYTTVAGLSDTTIEVLAEVCANSPTCTVSGGTERKTFDKNGNVVDAHKQEGDHPTGHAFDIHITPEISAAISEMEDSGQLKQVIRYPTFIHVATY